MRIRPVVGDELDTPEMRRGREKLESDALAFLGDFADKNYAAFLLFLREWIGENKYGVDMERLGQANHAAMRVDYDRFAGLTKTTRIRIFSSDNHAHAHENPRAASSLADFRLRHDTSMLRHFHFAVNESVDLLFLQRNLSDCSAFRRHLIWQSCIHMPHKPG